MTAVWTSRHEDLVSHNDVSPHVCDPMVVPLGWAVLDRRNPSRSVGDVCLDFATSALRAQPAAGGVLHPRH